MTYPDGPLEFKSAPVMDAPPAAPAPDPEGIVEALVAVTGVRDDVGDVIEPGAFKSTLAARKPKVVLGHDWNRPIGKVLQVKELLPGDSALPKTTADGKPWPREAGAVWARMQINLDSDDGRAAFSAAKFFGPEESTYSIGYKTTKATHKGNTRHIHELDLFEFGPVLHPANRLATLQSVKATMSPEDLENADVLASWEVVSKDGLPEGMTYQDYSASLASVESKARYVNDASYWGYPKGTLIRPGMKPRGKTSRDLRARGVVPSHNVGVSGKPGDRGRRQNASHVAITMGDEGLDLGLGEGGLTSTARVRARNPKGKDEEHLQELVDSSFGHGQDDIDQRDAAFEGLLDEGITPNELRDDLRHHPDMEGMPSEQSDDLVAEYAKRYQDLAKQQAAERGGNATGEQPIKPKPEKPQTAKPEKPQTAKPEKPQTAKPQTAKPEKPETSDPTFEITKLNNGLRGLSVNGQRVPVDVMENNLLKALIRDGRSIGPATDRLNTQAAKQDLAARLGALRSADGKPFPTAKEDVAAWKDDSGRNLPRAVQAALEEWVLTRADADSKLKFAIGDLGVAELRERVGQRGGDAPDAPSGYKPTGNMSAPEKLSDAELDAEIEAAKSKLRDLGARKVPSNSASVHDAKMAIKVFEDEKRKRANASTGQQTTTPAGETSTDALIRMKRDEGMAAVSKMSVAELERHDEEMARRAERLGKAGQVSQAHQAVKDALKAKRDAQATSAPDLTAMSDEDLADHKMDLVMRGQDATGKELDDIKAQLGAAIREQGRRKQQADGTANLPDTVTLRDGQALTRAELDDVDRLVMTDRWVLRDGEGLRTGVEIYREKNGTFTYSNGKVIGNGPKSLEEAVQRLNDMMGLQAQSGTAAPEAPEPEKPTVPPLKPGQKRFGELKPGDRILSPEDGQPITVTSVEAGRNGRVIVNGRDDNGNPEMNNLPGETAVDTPKDAPADVTGGRPAANNDTATIETPTIEDAQDLADESLGLHEAEDGELEVDADVADRQDRLDKMLRDSERGKLKLADRSTEELTGTRKDLAEELKLQEAIVRRDRRNGRPVGGGQGGGGGSTGGGRQTRTGGTQGADGPKQRPGLAGAGEDYADALASGDTAEIERTRARLLSSLRRSRSDSDTAKQLADYINNGGTDTERIRALINQMKQEARDRRNAQARDRRKAKRLERERLRSLLGQVDSELRGRGVELPADGNDTSIYRSDPTTITPQEYERLRDRAMERQYRASELVRKREEYQKEVAAIDASEQIARTAPDRIPDSAVPTGGVLVGDGRLILSNPTKVGWALLTADGSKLIAGDVFGGPGQKVKLTRRQLASLGDAIAAIKDANGNRIPTTAPDGKAWAPGFRDADGRDGRSALYKAVADWGDANGVPVADHVRRTAETNRRAGRGREPGVADAAGFYPAENIRNLSAGDVVRLPDGSTHTLREVRQPNSNDRTGRGYVLAFTDGTEHDTGSFSNTIDVRYADDPNRPGYADNPGMGFANVNMGRPPEQYIQQVRRDAQRAIDDGVAPGTRFVYTPHESSLDRDQRPRVGVTTGDVTESGGNWFQVVHYDDGTWDAISTGALQREGRLEINPSAQRAEEVRQAWRRPTVATPAEPPLKPGQIRVDGVVFDADAANAKYGGELPKKIGTTPDGNEIMISEVPYSASRWRFNSPQFGGDGETYATPEEAAAAGLAHEKALHAEVTPDNLGTLYGRRRAAWTTIQDVATKYPPGSQRSGIGDALVQSMNAHNALDKVKYQLAYAEKNGIRDSKPFDATRDYKTPVIGGNAKTRKLVDDVMRNVVMKGFTREQAEAHNLTMITAPKDVSGQPVSGTPAIATYSMGQGPGRGIMRINRDCFNETYASWQMRNEETGFDTQSGYISRDSTDPIRDNLIRTMVHEFGHHMDGLITPEDRHAMFSELSNEMVRDQVERSDATRTEAQRADTEKFYGERRYDSERGLATLQPKADGFGQWMTWDREQTEANQWVQRNKAWISNNIGRYAATNDREIIAELWTEYRGRGEESSPYAKIVGKYLMGVLDGQRANERGNGGGTAGGNGAGTGGAGQAGSARGTGRPGAAGGAEPAARGAGRPAGVGSDARGAAGAGTPAGAPGGLTDSGLPSGQLDDAQYQEHTKRIEQRINMALASGLATDAQYSKDGRAKEWTPERAAVHREIIGSLWAQNGASKPRQGKAVIAGGLGGAGKSTVLQGHAGINQADYMTINPDDIKEEMARRGLVPQIEGLSPMEASALVHEESSYLANVLADMAYENKTNVVWDITMSARGSVEKRIAAMRAAGYGQIDAVFVDIPVETSVERALARHRRGMEKHRAGNGDGGRYVPPAIIRKNNSSTSSSANRDVFNALKREFNDWTVYDNSVFGRDPVRIDGTGRWSGNALGGAAA